MGDYLMKHKDYWTHITVSLTKEQWENLNRLADKRGMTPEQCIRSFCEHIVPDGSGWEHPAKASVIRG